MLLPFQAPKSRRPQQPHLALSRNVSIECYRGIKEYFEYYNAQRRHQGLGNQTPLTIYEQTLKQVA